MTARRNCWEVKSCGREPGGASSAALGLCPVALETRCDGVNGGRAGGRVCWIVGGTFCGGEIQGTFAQKLASCSECEFAKRVRAEEGPAFDDGGSVLPLIHDPLQMARACDQLTRSCRAYRSWSWRTTS